jgi:signal peptidase II
VLAAVAAAGLALDQATKAWVTATVENRREIHVVSDVLMIDASRNSGAAFSFAPAATVLFTALALGMALFIVLKATQLRSAAWAIALGLILAGALGNLTDRLTRSPGIGRGAVVDFIDLRHFATFNVADSCITIGVVLAGVLALRGVSMIAAKPTLTAPEPTLTAPEPTLTASKPTLTASKPTLTASVPTEPPTGARVGG